MRLHLVFLGLLVIVFSSAVAHAKLAEFADYQLASGGFVLPMMRIPSTDATRKGLFVSALFGLDVDFTAAVEFFGTLRGEEGGFSSTIASEPDIYATRDAVWGMRIAKQSIQEEEKIVSFVTSLYDEGSGRFSSDAKSTPDLMASAAAIQIFELLGKSESTFVQSSLSKLKDFLENAWSDSLFQLDDRTSALESNYYGVYLAKKCGMVFDSKKMVQFLVSMQNMEYGGFSFGEESPNIRASAFALETLRLLDAVASIDVETLVQFAMAHLDVHDLDAQFHAAQVLATSGRLNDLFQKTLLPLFSLNNERISGDQFIQGGVIQPYALIRVQPEVFDTSFEVQISAELPNGEIYNSEMKYAKDARAYVASKPIDTTPLLGEMEVIFTAQKNVFGVGDINIRKVETKRIGYRMNITDFVETKGVPVRRYGEITPETRFEFEVSLSDFSEQPIRSVPNTEVVLTVRESSGAVLNVFHQTLDLESNDDKFQFSFGFTEVSLTVGPIDFTFEVVESSKGVHTSQSIAYMYSVFMVASRVSFQGFANDELPSFKVGDSVLLNMVPGVVSAEGSAIPLAPVLNGKNVVGQRRFEVALVVGENNVLSTYPGIPASDGSSGYTFSFAVEPTFEYVSSPSLVFRYITSQGYTIDIERVEAGFLEAGQSLRLPVDAKVYIDNFEANFQTSELPFGSDISLKFKVLDRVSGTVISSSSSRIANVHAQLIHYTEKNVPIACGRVPASSSESGAMLIDWKVGANAIGGRGALLLAVFTDEGKVMDLLTSYSSNDRFLLPVKIVGDVEWVHEGYVTRDSVSQHSMFAAQFQVLAGKTPLQGASLVASVRYMPSSSVVGEIVSDNIPVSFGANATYQVSLSLPHRKAPSGSYMIELHRADGLSESVSSSDDTQRVPLYSIPLSHTRLTSFSIKTNFASYVFVFFAGIAIAIGYYLDPRSRIVTSGR